MTAVDYCATSASSPWGTYNSRDFSNLVRCPGFGCKLFDIFIIGDRDDGRHFLPSVPGELCALRTVN